jgi:hypothetical protein
MPVRRGGPTTRDYGSSRNATRPPKLGNADPYSEFPPVSGILIYILGVFGGVALLFTALILALFRAERGRHWGWFGGLLAVSILTSILSGLGGFYFPLAFLILALTVAAYGLLGPNISSQSVQANASNPGP